MGETSILIVEDELIIARNLRRKLQKMGYEVTGIASSSEAAIESVMKKRPDIILMDIVMPDMSGLDVCRNIRQDMNYKIVPIVFVTTKSEDFDKFWALRQGGNDYITKPYSPTNLINIVKKYL